MSCSPKIPNNPSSRLKIPLHSPRQEPAEPSLTYLDRQAHKTAFEGRKVSPTGANHPELSARSASRKKRFFNRSSLRVSEECALCPSKARGFFTPAKFDRFARSAGAYFQSAIEPMTIVGFLCYLVNVWERYLSENRTVAGSSARCSNYKSGKYSADEMGIN